MNSLNAKARIAGFLYLALVAIGPIALVYVPSVLFVSGNAIATTHNIATHESLLRIGIFADLVSATLFIFVVLAIYQLLSTVNRSWAVVMVILGIVQVPIFFLNTLNEVGALQFASGASYLSAFTPGQREAMTMFFVTLHHYGVVVNEAFWGLWLLPFGMLVYKSGFLPRILGALLILNGCAYVAQNVADVLFPQFTTIVDTISSPFQLGEVAITLWLLIMGANEKRPPIPGTPSRDAT